MLQAMKHSLRWILLLVLLMFLSAGGALLWIVQHEAEAESAVLESIASHLLTDAHIGDVTLDIWTDFPRISLRLEDVVLLGSSGSPSDTLLKADQLQLHCNAFQLLRGQYQIESASMEGGFVSLLSSPDGSWNTAVWKTDDAENQSEARFAINGLTLTQCEVHIDEMSMRLPDMHITGAWKNAILHATIEGTVEQFSLQKDDDPLLDAAVLLVAQWDESTGKASIQIPRAEWMEGQWQTEILYDTSSGWSCEGTFDDIPARLVLPLLELSKPYNSLSSNALLSGKFTSIDGELGMQITLPKQTWSIATDELNHRIEGQVQASIWAKYAQNQWRIDVPKCTLELDGLAFDGALNAFNPERGSFEQSQLHLQLDALQLGEWWGLVLDEGFQPTKGSAHWNGLLSRDAQGVFTANGTWEATNWSGLEESGAPWEFTGNGTLDHETLEIERFDARWGEDYFSGSAGIIEPLSWTSSRPVRGHAEINLESYSYKSSAQEPVLLSELHLPAGSRIDWSVTCDRGQYGSWALHNIEAQGRLESDLWKVHRFQSETLEGQFSGDGQVLFIPDEDRAVVQWHAVATTLNLPSLFQAFDNFDQATLRAEHLQGALTASGSMQFDWNHTIAWLPETFEMLAEAKVEQGALRKLEAFEAIAQYLRDNRMMAPLLDPDDLSRRLEEVVFQTLETPLYVAKQSVHLPAVQIRSSAMNISLEGSYAFNGALDYTLGFAMRDLRSTEEGQFGPIEDDGLGQQFFIQMHGNVTSPEYRWDREAQRNHRKSNFQREKELLKSLFKRS